MPKIQFVGGAYTERSKTLDAQQCVNLYPVTAQQDSKSVIALYGTPGLKRLITLPTSPVRGLHRWGTYLYAVAGTTLYRGDAYGTATVLGTIAGSDPVDMADNGTQLVITNGSYGYVWDGVTLSGISFLAGNGLGFMDGYFISGVPGAGQFQISALYDGTDWDAIDIGSVEGSPDNLVTLLVDHRELWLFGDDSTEIFYNSGDTSFPFRRIDGAFIEYGCAAKHSPAKLANTVFWLSSSDYGAGQVVMASGYQPVIISTPAIDFAIQSYETVSDAIGFAYQQDGHNFYVLTFPTEGKTWVFDATTNLWHERAYRITSTGSLTRWRANCHAHAFGKHIVGDFENGKLYELDLNYYSDDGDPIKSIRSAQHISTDYRNLVHNALQVDMETGVGIDGTGQGDDPVAILEWSDDGGRSWSNEHTAKLGKIGETLSRVIWRRLGVSRDRVYRLTITDPVKRVIIGARLDAAGGSS